MIDDVIYEQSLKHFDFCNFAVFKITASALTFNLWMNGNTQFCQETKWNVEKEN